MGERSGMSVWMQLSRPQARRWLAGALLWLLVVAAACSALAEWRIQAQRADALTAADRRLSALDDNVVNHFTSLTSLGQVLARQPQFAHFLEQDGRRDTARLAAGNRLTLQRQLSTDGDVQAMSMQLASLTRDFQITRALILDTYGTVIADSALAERQTDALAMNVATRPYFIHAMDRGRGFQDRKSTPLNSSH